MAEAPPMSPRSRLESFRREQQRQASAADQSPASPRSRLDSFRASRGGAQGGSSGGFSVQLPPSDASTAELSIPSLSLREMSSPSASGVPGPLSSRRLKKEVLRADSMSAEASNSAGNITLRDGSGTPRSVRVVQSEEFEDFNMVSIKWVYTLDAEYHKIVLRHGRRSGIRKIYVDNTLVERTKTIAGYFVDKGSTHRFEVGGRPATISIGRGKSAGYTYALSIDGEEIERDLGITAAGLAAELGTHFIRPVVGADGFGMTLANCGQREDGVVVLELEPGFPAHRAGLLVGDILLSVGEECVVDTNVIVDKLTHARGEVILEVAGCSPSRLVTVPNPHYDANGRNGAITLADTACGVGVYVSSVSQPRHRVSGAGQLEVGDVVLSVDGAVTESAKETMKYIERAPDPLTFVVAGRKLIGVATDPAQGFPANGA